MNEQTRTTGKQIAEIGVTDSELAENAKIRAVQEAIEASGASEVLIEVSRMTRDRGKVYVRELRVAVSEIGDYKERIAEFCGGGKFHVRFKVSGKFAGSDLVEIDGDPLPAPRRVAEDLDDDDEEEDDEDEREESAAQEALNEVAELKAELAARDERDRRARIRAKRAADQSARDKVLLDAIAATNSKVNDLLTTKAAPAPGTMSADQVRIDKLEDELKRVTKESAKREADDLKTQIAGLSSKIEDLSKPRRPEKDPFAEALAGLTGLATVKTAFAALAKTANDEDDEFLKEALEVFKIPMLKMLKDKAGELARDTKKAIDDGLKTKPPKPAPPVPDDFGFVINEVFKDHSLVEHIEWIRSLLPKHGPQLEAWASITDDESMERVVLATLGQGVVDSFKASQPQARRGVIAICAKLRATIELAKKPPEPAPSPAAAPPEPAKEQTAT